MYCQGLSEIICQKLSETENEYLALALLGIHLKSVYRHPVVAFSRLKVSLQISVEQYRLRIIFHDHPVNGSLLGYDVYGAKYGNNVINCGRMSLGVSSHAKIETSCYTIHIVE